MFAVPGNFAPGFQIRRARQHHYRVAAFMEILRQKTADVAIASSDHDSQRLSLFVIRSTFFGAFFNYLHSVTSQSRSLASLLRVSWSLRHGACVRGATSLRSDVGVARTQHVLHAPRLCKPHERARPPNLACERHNCVRAAELSPIGKQQAYLAQQFVARHAEQRAHAWILERSNGHSSAMQNRCKPSRDACAETALGVEKQPASRVPS